MKDQAQSFGFEEMFPPRDKLADITAEFAGAEIAAALDIPSAQPSENVLARIETLIQRFCVLPDFAYLPLAVWIMATHLSNAFDAFPYIALLSPEKRCGKTRVLEVLELLCANPWRGTSTTSAALYRMMTACPTLLLDEVEALRGRQVSENSQAVLAVLNAGHRKGATVPRCDGPKNELKFFPVYGPKAFAAIGRLPDTLADRCICLEMQRKTTSQHVERFLSNRARMTAEPILEALSDWAKKNEARTEAAYEHLEDLGFLSDRDADLWMPLFAICSVAAPDRVTELENCALTLTGAKADNDVEESLSLKLLADIRSVWVTGRSHMATSELLEALKRITDSPWGENDFNPRKIAKMLRPFKVEVRQVRLGAGTYKGYLRSELLDAFSRYLPSHAGCPETCETTGVAISQNAGSGPETLGYGFGSMKQIKP